MKTLVVVFGVFVLISLPVKGEEGLAPPEQVTPEQATPEQATPEQATPEQATPPKSPTFYAGLNYSYFDLIVPSKYGFTLGYIAGPQDIYEFEYLRASISLPLAVVKDLGSFSEVRMSLLDRHFFGEGSFNAHWGIVYGSNKLTVGSGILSRVSSESIPKVKPLVAETLGVVGGLGNRWRLSHGISLGIDWFSWAQPLITIKTENQFRDVANNENDRENIDTAVKMLSHFPRIAVLKLAVGVSF